MIAALLSQKQAQLHAVFHLYARQFTRHAPSYSIARSSTFPFHPIFLHFSISFKQEKTDWEMGST